jgi:4-diphosphocytidyl-2-C-methyl-D-erythritol kinase
VAHEWDHQLAPAKLTLSLKITGVRRDGLHLLDAEMVSLDLADELWFGPGDSLEVLGSERDAVPVGEDNLVRRALRTVGCTAAVRLLKRIPAGGGLGGGSADAAAVLRWAAAKPAGEASEAAWAGRPAPGGPGPAPGGPGPATYSDLALAARLGADVPFCVGGGRARVRGVGELVEPLPGQARSFTLVMPPFGVLTARVYAAWDELGGPTADGPNDLEPAALSVEPRLAPWRDALGEATGVQPILAGSGSTWFVEGDSLPAERLMVADSVGRLVVVRTRPWP